MFAGHPWPGAGYPHPTIMAAAPVPASASHHRSMHDLSMGFPSAFPQASAPNIVAPSGQGGSQRGKNATAAGRRRSGANNGRLTPHQQSRPHSRASGNKRRSKEISDEDSDEEDFFTGESEQDFLSISSGGWKGQKQTQAEEQRSWVCEHCTFVNPAEETVCAVCCKTATKVLQQHQQEQESVEVREEREPTRNLKANHREEQRESRGGRVRRLRAARDFAKSPMPLSMPQSEDEEDEEKAPNGGASDLEQDAIDTYYAVRMSHDKSVGRGASGMISGEQDGQNRDLRA